MSCGYNLFLTDIEINWVGIDYRGDKNSMFSITAIFLTNTVSPQIACIFVQKIHHPI